LKFRWWNIFSWPGEISRLHLVISDLRDEVRGRDDYVNPLQMQSLVYRLIGKDQERRLEERNEAARKALFDAPGKSISMPEYTDAEADQILEDAKNSFRKIEPTMTIDEYNKMLDEKLRIQNGCSVEEWERRKGWPYYDRS